MKYILAIDMGTTSVKASIVDSEMNIVSSISREASIITDSGGVVEFDPIDRWSMLKECILKQTTAAPEIGAKIAAVVCTSFGETVMPVDKEGMPIRSAFVWYDSRAVDEAKHIAQFINDDEYYGTTGVRKVSEVVPPSKILWFKNHCPDEWNRTFKFLQMEDYIIYKFTNIFATDISVTCGSGYYDIINDKYWKKMLGVIGASEDMFPKMHGCGEIIGPVIFEVSTQLHINPEAVVVTGGLDQTCSCIATGNIYPNILSEGTGTAMVVLSMVEEPDFQNSSKPVYIRSYNGKYVIMALSRTGGVVLRWFRDEFCKEEKKICEKKGLNIFDYMDLSASKVAIGSEGLKVVPYFIGKITPNEVTSMRGAFVGVDLNTKKEYFVRAIMEAVGYMLRENIDMFRSFGVKSDSIICMGGGAKSHLWNSIKANICNMKIKTLNTVEAATLGAAVLGAVAVGICESVPVAVEKIVSIKREYIPEDQAALQYDKLYNEFLLLNEKIIEYYESISD